MKTFLTWVAAVALTATAFAEETLKLPVMTPAAAPKSGDFVFNFLPKSFQGSPVLDMTVFGEVTSHGRSLPVASTVNPVYYVAHDVGMKQYGETVGGDVPPPADYLNRILRRSLSTSGFLPASEKTPDASLVLIYHWGSHNAMDQESEARFPLVARKQRIERAKLVGGPVLARSQAWDWDSIFRRWDWTPEKEFLSYQAAKDLYFVVVSAYDRAALAAGQRLLAWRANLTVNASGVAMYESLPPLVLSAGPYFGQDTTNAQILRRRVRRGVVEIGTATVVENASLPGSNSRP